MFILKNIFKLHKLYFEIINPFGFLKLNNNYKKKRKIINSKKL